MLNLSSLADLWAKHASEAGPVRPMQLRGRVLDFQKAPSVMGVINLSADSWYRESVCLSHEMAVRRGRVLVAQGADIVDIGAESTLAHAARADTALQSSRLLPVIRALANEGVLVSAETYDPQVAQSCLEAGAAIINLTGPECANDIYRMAAAHDAAVIICYVQGDHVRAVGDFRLDADPIPRMREYFARELERAGHVGLEKVFIDPGLGFYYKNLQDSSVRVQHQMKTFLNTFRLGSLGFPICHALPHAFEFFGEEVRSAEPFFAVMAAMGQTHLYRTHEVAKTRAVLNTLGTWQA